MSSKARPTYKQSAKNKSRWLIWNEAIRRLTSDRAESRIISELYARKLWEYSLEKVLRPYRGIKQLDRRVLDEWCAFAQSQYGTRRPSDLRVAYLSGPEPENDLSILLELGVHVSNVWAFEREANLFSDALKRARQLHPSLKLYPGKIEDLIGSTDLKFDVIYLDFTGPLFSATTKPYRTLHSILENHGLSPLSVLILNLCEPEQNLDTVTFLADYFQNQMWVEGTVFGLKHKTGKDVYWYVEGPEYHGYDNDALLKLVSENFSSAYSAFATQYPAMYANYVQPSLAVLTNDVAKKQFFNSDQQTLDAELNRFSSPDALFAIVKRVAQRAQGGKNLPEISLGSDFLLSANCYPLQHFLARLESRENKDSRKFLGSYHEQSAGVSRLKALQSFDLLRSIMEGYFEVLSPKLLEAIRAVYAALPDPKGGLFCDIPMIHLWVEAALYQLGFPYHVNVRGHWRANYRAKVHRIYLDCFVLDQCRDFYDWMPLVDLYREDVTPLERLLIQRICMDSICKARGEVLPRLYSGANLIGRGEEKWARAAEIPPRIAL